MLPTFRMGSRSHSLVSTRSCMSDTTNMWKFMSCLTLRTTSRSNIRSDRSVSSRPVSNSRNTSASNYTTEPVTTPPTSINQSINKKSVHCRRHYTNRQQRGISR